MKMDEVRVGGRYVLGRDEGRNGVVSTGQRVLLRRKHVRKNEFSDRYDHVEIALLDDDGNPKTYEDNDYNRRWNSDDIGKLLPWKTIRPKLLLSLQEVERREREAEQARLDHERRVQLTQEAQEEMIEILVGAGLDEKDISVRSRWDGEHDIAEISSVNIRGESVNLMVGVFVDAWNRENQKEKDEA